MTWRLSPGQLLRLLSSDDESVVYNDQSGATHMISMLATRLLQRLQQAPADTAVLAAFCAAEWDLDSDDFSEFELSVAEQLAGLADAGLVEPCPS